MKILPYLIKVSLVLVLPCLLYAIDNPHFWRATNFLTEFYEPRLERAWLTSFESTLGFGSTRKARNGQDETVPLLDIYDTYNMQLLGVNVPDKNPADPGTIVMDQLALLPTNDGFAHFSYNGKFAICEANLSFSQNFDYGFFMQAHVPIRRIKITDITQTDLSPLAGNPNRNNPTWQSFLTLFPHILNTYQLSIGPVSKTGIGDLSILSGWTKNYENTEEIDFIDATIRFGVLVPTGKRKNENLVFDLPLGYNGHYAVQGSFDSAIGWYDWLTIGGHFGAMVFFKRTQLIRLKTAAEQSGLIMLALDNANVRPGAILEANTYIKADHVILGFSLLVGYNFAMQNSSLIEPVTPLFFNPVILNSNEQFSAWKMHTINFGLDWDFTDYNKPNLPHMGIFYNVIVGGKRIFATNMAGFETGLYFCWQF